MSYAAAVARAKYEEKVFKFKDEPEQPDTKLEVIPGGSLNHWQPGFEFFQVYPWLRAKYTTL